MSLCDYAMPYVRAISPYLPGKPITQLAREMGIPVERIVKLASNENPLGISPKAKLAIEKAVAQLIDLTPRGIRTHLGLNRPIYQRTSAYGHFGREVDNEGGFSWERLDLADKLKAAV